MTITLVCVRKGTVFSFCSSNAGEGGPALSASEFCWSVTVPCCSFDLKSLMILPNTFEPFRSTPHPQKLSDSTLCSKVFPAVFLMADANCGHWVALCSKNVLHDLNLFFVPRWRAIDILRQFLGIGSSSGISNTVCQMVVSMEWGTFPLVCVLSTPEGKAFMSEYYLEKDWMWLLPWNGRVIFHWSSWLLWILHWFLGWWRRRILEVRPILNLSPRFQ